jgi:transposase-like protein
MLHGFLTGVTTLRLSDELQLNRCNLLQWRHTVQALFAKHSPPCRLEDRTIEADEMFQNAGEKGVPHHDADDPPRRRANKQRGQGTFENDRPPIAGVVGRESGQLRTQVVPSTDVESLQGHLEATTRDDAIVHTDEARGYVGLPKTGRVHHTVCHSIREYARDDDRDGVYEVHCNTQEGIWTGVRNFLRPFRGVSKWFLDGYLALFGWVYNQGLVLRTGVLASIFSLEQT